MRDLGLLGRISIIVFTIECTIMLSLAHLPEALIAFFEMHAWVLPLLDTTVLVLLSSPLIYLWVVRPFVLGMRQSEERLEANNAVLREAQRISQIGSWELDLVNDRLSWSKETYRIFGIEQGAFSGSQREFLKLIHPDDVEYVKDAYGKSLKRRTPYLFEHRAFLPDGTTIWVEARCQTEYAPNGEPLKSIGTIQNITARKQAEFDIRDLKASLDLTDEAIFMAWRDTQEVFYCNRAASDLMGRTSVGSMTKQVGSLFKSVGGGCFDEFTASFDSGTEMSRRIEIEDAQDRNIEITVQLVSPENGEARYVLIVRDITERSAALRAKTEFLSTVSHELRTPLTAIRGAISLLKSGVSGELPKKSAALLEIADRNGATLASLVDDLLSSEKMQSGQMSYDMKPTDLGDLVQNSLGNLSAFADRKDIALNYTPPQADNLFVLGDSFRLAQVVANLVSNAVKFSEPGQTVDVSLDLARDGKVRVNVRDTGAGIPEKAHGTLFERFSQADSSDTRSQGGTGLGLSISKMIVESHNGTIGFTSEQGVGSTFWIELGLVSNMVETKTAGSTADSTADSAA